MYYISKNKPNFIDEDFVFQINPEFEDNISVKQIGNRKSKIITVDNFYKNPEEVRNLIFASPSSRKYSITASSPGYRSKVQMEFPNFVDTVRYLIKKHFQYNAFENLESIFQTNILHSSFKLNNDNILPHRDKGFNFAVSVFLNYENECRGGTAFYKHIKTGLEGYPSTLWSYYKDKKVIDKKEYWTVSSAPTYHDMTFKCLFNDKDEPKYDWYITESNNRWELIHIEKMKWNKLVIYESNIFHSPYIQKEWFNAKDSYRISQIFFV